MNPHKYLRAYMAGIVVPNVVLVLGVTAFAIARYAYDWPIALERVMIFPMAVVPNLWGLWNILFIATHSRTRLSVGLHGALLPFLLGPLGILLTGTLQVQFPNFRSHVFPYFAVLSLIVYYLVWKYVVGFFNAVLGIA